MQASLHQLLVAVHAHARRGGPAPTRHVPLLAAMLLLYMEPQAPTAPHHSPPPQPPTRAPRDPHTDPYTHSGRTGPQHRV